VRRWPGGLLAACVALGPASAGSLGGAGVGADAPASSRYCDAPNALDATQQDRLLRFAAVLKARLEASGRPLALVARSGLDLRRFGQRYSHAGISLQASPNTPWSVRQLYYACDEGRPRLYDQGLAGFVSATDDASLGYVSVLLLPSEAGAALARVALDNRAALRLLGDAYSANAYPFGLRYQNCNQWLAELMALAWGGAPAEARGELDPDGAAADADPAGRARQAGPAAQAAQAGQPHHRAAAQAWLQASGYAPTQVALRTPLWRLAALFVPWLHEDDHPPEDLAAGVVQVSLPAALEAFVLARHPAAERLELCHRGTQVVVRRGGRPIAEGCVAERGDEVLRLD